MVLWGGVEWSVGGRSVVALFFFVCGDGDGMGVGCGLGGVGVGVV